MQIKDGTFMGSVRDQIHSAERAICNNISQLAGQRDLLSQNILSQLRNLVEGVAVLFHSNNLNSDFLYDKVNPALAHIGGSGKLNFLNKFHKLLQISVSHYTVEGDSSERLMLKYYEYLHRIRALIKSEKNIDILSNLECFPVDLDPSLREYHEKIASVVEEIGMFQGSTANSERYYIHRKRPFFCFGRIYYEVTFYRATNKANKFDRIIAFTNFDIADKHAAMLTLHQDNIKVLGQFMPITIIRKWSVSIRPCELKNFSKILDLDIDTRTNSFEYQHLMNYLSNSSTSLLDFVTSPELHYMSERAKALSSGEFPQIFLALDKARGFILNNSSGHNVIRYLLLRMNNQIIKAQHSRDSCYLLSNLNLEFGCNPFDKMPFCTSLIGHNPRFSDVAECIELHGREHELFARKIKNNVEQNGVLYTPISELSDYGDINTLITNYNKELYYKHMDRQLCLDKGHVFVQKYEEETASIINHLQDSTVVGIAGYTQAVEQWLTTIPKFIDDPTKVSALKNLFSLSKVALIYGAAGTGKSTMIHHIAQYFNDKSKLFLAHTNPAIDNLKRRVSAQNSTFRTISKQARGGSAEEFDVLIIDECSTVSNADLLKVLQHTSYKLLVLVGDSYQIESIQFGNWFTIAPSFIPNLSVFELKTPFRTDNEELLKFWGKVRESSNDLAEIMVKNNYSTDLDSSLFENYSEDEIILCLNYDGLYGINNINRFLQSGNQGARFFWRESTYKIGDPVLFSDSERFRPVIYNNLKGWIVNISQAPGWIQFDIRLDRDLNEFDVSYCYDLTWVSESIVRFTVFDSPHSSDDDDDTLNTTVPFQVAYAVSIHKAQGLEYSSVKIVITDANEDDISHSIFYTAITRAMDRLKIFWTPETQQKVLNKLTRKASHKDAILITGRKNLKRLN